MTRPTDGAPAPENPLKVFEAILEYGKKDSTYKFSVLRAIVEWVIENPIEVDSPVRIPISWIAERSVGHYWPLVKSDVPQWIAKKDRRFGYISLFEHFQEKTTGNIPINTSSDAPEFWSFFRDHMDSADTTSPELNALVASVRDKLLDQPMRYLQNLQGSEVSLLTIEYKDHSQFHEAREAAKDANRGVQRSQSFSELVSNDPAKVLISPELYNGLLPLRFCLHTSILTKWALFSAEQKESKKTSVDILQMMQDVERKRDELAIRRYRTLYIQNDLAKTCVITGKRLREDWQVDHMVPWIRFPLDTFWNLYPLTKQANQRKAHKIVKIKPVVRDRIEAHLSACLEIDHPLIQRDLQKAGGTARARPSHLYDHLESVLVNLERTTGLPTLTVPWD